MKYGQHVVPVTVSVLSVTIGNAKHLEEKQIKILMKSNKIKFTNITRVNKK